MSSILTIEDSIDDMYDCVNVEDCPSVTSHCIDCGGNLHGNELACLLCHGEKIDELAQQYRKFCQKYYKADDFLKNGNINNAVGEFNALQSELVKFKSILDDVAKLS